MTPHLATAKTPFFLVCGRDPNLPLHQLLEPMQWLLGDPESWQLDLKSHHLALAIAKKTLEEKKFKYAQKTTNGTSLNFKTGDKVYFKNKQPGKWDLKWTAGYRIVCIENQATGKPRPCSVKIVVHELLVEQWNVDTKFGRTWKFINHPANLPTIPQNTA